MTTPRALTAGLSFLVLILGGAVPGLFEQRPAETTATADATRSSPRLGGPPVRCTVPSGVRAPQVLLVGSAGSRATVSACVRRSGGVYHRVLGPYAGRVGYNGVAKPGRKREGDGHTPAGVFRLRGGFGTAADPGLRLGWRVVDGRDVWVDDPQSALYNTHRRLPARGRWRSAERLRVPAYRFAQVIGYNEARRPGRGSAIFLHVSTGGATAGCVSLPVPALRTVLRWERAGAVVAIS